MRRLWVILLLALAAGPAFGQAEDPAAQRREEARLNVARRLREAVDQLDLSAEQRARLARLFEENEARATSGRKLAREDPAAARKLMVELAERTRQGLAEILTPEQQVRLRELMQRRPEAPPPPPPPPPPPVRREAPSPPPQARSTTPPAGPTTRPATALLGLPAVKPGRDAPAIRAVDLDGKAVTLESLPRKPVVIVFGSHSCPSFRQRLPMLADLAKTYQKRVHFLVVYTREAHAAGEWEVERNRDERIEVIQPADLEARLALARSSTKSAGKDIAVVVDSMDDETVRAYGLFPNGAAVLNRDRKVVGVQRWVDPFTLPELIAEAR